jgi:type I restriction enzyme S subunit
MKAGWQQKELGQLAELKGRIGWRGLTAKEYTKSGPLFLSVHSLNYGDYVDFRDAFHISEGRYDESPEIMLQRDDVLICKDGAGIGKVGIVGGLPDRATINSSLLLIRSGTGLLPKFLYHCLSSPYFQAIVNSRLNGATTPHLYQRDIAELPIFLPPSSEQRRIVGILDEAFEGIATAKANAEKNLQNARALFESHLQAIFTQPGEWCIQKTLDDICMKITDGEHLRPEVTPSGVPFLSAKDVLDRDVVFTDPLFVSEADAQKFRKRCDPEMGDILIVSRGATVGRTCLVKTPRSFCLLGSVILLKVAATVSAPFIAYALKSPSIRKQLITASEASAQQAIYLRDIKLLKIGCPSITEQRAIVSKLDALRTETQRLEAIYGQKLAALDALKKSLLDQAFTGLL